MSLKELKKVSVVGIGLLGASVTLAVSRGKMSIKTSGYGHRPKTRERARELSIASEIPDTLQECVKNAGMVILATPISIFERMFHELSDMLPEGCIVTDVGSTKTEPHRWAKKILRGKARYVGSHPIAGSEKRGVDYARDDLFFGAKCILTRNASTDADAFDTVWQFWESLGSRCIEMTPVEHDRIFAAVSHVPHVTAAALVNATDPKKIIYAGKGFIDTSRVASGPANIWMDILLSNSSNIAGGLNRVIRELEKIRDAVVQKDTDKIERELEKARKKRAELIEYKVSHKELF